MNLATALVLVLVLLVLTAAAYRTYRMVLRNDLCYACPHQGECGGYSPINCTFRKEE